MSEPEEPPTARLCWKRDPVTGARCDRQQHSSMSRHWWDVLHKLEALETLERPRTLRRKRTRTAR